MKRTLLTSLALSLGFAAAADAQSRYGYRTAPNGDCEVVDHHQPVQRPILRRLVGDLRIAKEEIDKGIFEMRDELRRAIHGGEASTYRNDVDYHTTDSFGTYSPETLERARRNAEMNRRERAEREATIRRELELERQRRLAEEQRFEPRRQRNIGRPNGIRVPAPRRDDDFVSTPEDNTPPKIVRPRTEKKTAEVKPAPRREDTPPPSPHETVGPPTKDDFQVTTTKPDQPAIEDNTPTTRVFTEAEKRNFPLAATTDKPGFVRSPYPPFELLDVRGLEAGSLAREPETERIFRVPE